MSTEDQGEDVSSVSVEREPFIMLPIWMLDASANAVKLYAVLRRFADNATLNAWPGKQVLAEAMGYKLAKNVDPALRELEEMGAVVVTRRSGAGMRLANHYHIITKTPVRKAPRQPQTRAPKPAAAPAKPAAPQETKNPEFPVGPNQVLPESQYNPNRAPRRTQTGPHVGPEKGLELRTKLTTTKELEPAESELSARSADELPIEGIPASNVVAIGTAKTSGAIARTAAIEAVAKQAYEDTNHGVSYMGLRKITTWAAGQGYHPNQVQAAFRDLWNAGRAVTQQTVAQYLAGIINTAGRAPAASTTDQRVAQGMSLADEFRKMEESQ
jgi:hypothetical protein